MKKLFDYQFFVIGAGSGGTRAARMAAKKGIKTGIAEAYRAGGTCVIRGCVPKKLYSYAAHFKEEFDSARFYGYDMPDDIQFNWSILQKNKNQEIARLEGIYENLLKNSGVTLYNDTATLLSPHEIYLKNSNKKITAEKILIATGASPRPLQINNQNIGFTSDDIFNFDDLPQKILIYGSGYISVEFAAILNNLGVDVTIAYRGNRLLKNFDLDISQKLEDNYLQNGIKLHANTPISDLKLENNQVFIEQNSQKLFFDKVFNTIGRIPNISALNLDKIGVELTDNGLILVKNNFQTSIDNIYAIGDVSNSHNLTPVAIQEAMCLTQTLFDSEPLEIDYNLIPTAVFSNPEIGTVGKTQQQAQDQGYKLNIFESNFRPMKYSFTNLKIRNYIKVIVDQETDIVLGVHLLGPNSAEFIQLIGIAVKARLTKKQFDATMAVHPTTAEEIVTMREVSRQV